MTGIKDLVKKYRVVMMMGQGNLVKPLALANRFMPPPWEQILQGLAAVQEQPILV